MSVMCWQNKKKLGLKHSRNRKNMFGCVIIMGDCTVLLYRAGIMINKPDQYKDPY